MKSGAWGGHMSAARGARHEVGRGAYPDFPEKAP
jgi:hypothetical protein